MILLAIIFALITIVSIFFFTRKYIKDSSALTIENDRVTILMWMGLLLCLSFMSLGSFIVSIISIIQN